MTVNQHGDEPIIVITLDDTMNAQAVANAYLESVDLSEHMAQPGFRLVDIQAAGSSFAEKTHAIREIVRGIAGAATYPDMLIAYVGQPHMAQTFAELHLPFFANHEAALDYVHARLADALMKA
jgi:hypothetical protein